MTQQVIKRYYDAFNAGDRDAILAELSDTVVHHVNEGERRIGKDKFRSFLEHMDRCYREVITDLVILTTPDGSRAAAEFMVNGTYLKTDSGLPAAHGQTYRLPAGAFFDLADGKITRVTTYYNLAEWVRQVTA